MDDIVHTFHFFSFFRPIQHSNSSSWKKLAWTLKKCLRARKIKLFCLCRARKWMRDDDKDAKFTGFSDFKKHADDKKRCCYARWYVGECISCISWSEAIFHDWIIAVSFSSQKKNEYKILPWLSDKIHLFCVICMGKTQNTLLWQPLINVANVIH